MLTWSLPSTWGCGGALVVFLLMAGCTSLPPATEYPRTPSHALDIPAETPLRRMLGRPVAAHLEESGFRLLADSTQSLTMRLLLADLAQHTIDAQYFIFRDDRTGRLLLQALLLAADRGVRVRLLIDGYSDAADDFILSTLHAHANVQVRLFNPFTAEGLRFAEMLVDGQRLNRRMHNKSFIVDNQVAIFGGRNIGNEYFNAQPDYDFRDLDVLGAGPVARGLSAQFDEYWNGARAYPVSVLRPRMGKVRDLPKLRRELAVHAQRMLKSTYGQSLRQPELVAQVLDGNLPLTWARAQVVADPPEKISQPPDGSASPPMGQLRSLAAQTRRELVIITPYFVPNRRAIEFLGELHDRGTRVRVLTNSLDSTDTPLVMVGYGPARRPLLERGVELHELKAQPQTGQWRQSGRLHAAAVGLHAKAYVFDRQVVLLGSVNVDPRSAALNTEVAVVIHSPDLAAQVITLFEQATLPAHSYQVRLRETRCILLNWIQPLTWLTEERGKLRRYHNDPEAGLWPRFTAWLTACFPIKSQL